MTLPLIFIQDDAIRAMARIPDASVALVFADPPYGISKVTDWKNTWNGYRAEKGPWDYVEGNYDDFTRLWITEVVRLLRPGGIICISGVFGSLVPTYHTLQDLGMTFQSHFIWHKTNPAPSVQRRMFTHANEIILIYSKGPRWIFNYEDVKVFNGGKQQHNVLSLGCQRKLNGIIRKPDKLLELFIRAFTNPGDTICDPFVGTGTTMVVASKLGRGVIGIDISAESREAVHQRLGWEVA